MALRILRRCHDDEHYGMLVATFLPPSPDGTRSVSDTAGPDAAAAAAKAVAIRQPPPPKRPRNEPPASAKPPVLPSRLATLDFDARVVLVAAPVGPETPRQQARLLPRCQAIGLLALIALLHTMAPELAPAPTTPRRCATCEL